MSSRRVYTSMGPGYPGVSISEYDASITRLGLGLFASSRVPLVLYSKFSCLRNREIETETLIFAPISLSYIEID